MLDTVANVLLNIFSRWADRLVVRINVKHLEYNLVRNDPDSVLVRISPSPSRYYAEVDFSHRGKATTIKSLTLVVDGKLSLEAEGFGTLKLEHGGYYNKSVVFPVEEKTAITEGDFEIRAIDAFDKVIHRCRGRFPIVPA